MNLDVERQPSRLRIETIDAFNAWLASQLPISAGAGSAFQVLADAAPCYEEAARRALAHEEDDQFGAAVDRVLAHRRSALAPAPGAHCRHAAEPRPLAAAARGPIAGGERARRGAARARAAAPRRGFAAVGGARADPRARGPRRGEDRRAVAAGARRCAARCRGAAGIVRLGAGRLALASRHRGSRAMARRRAALADRRGRVSQAAHQERRVSRRSAPTSRRCWISCRNSIAIRSARQDPGGNSQAAGAGLQRRTVGAGSRGGAGAGAGRGGIGPGVSRAGRRGFSRGVAGGAARAWDRRTRRPIWLCGSTTGCSIFWWTNSRTPRARSWNWCGC